MHYYAKWSIHESIHHVWLSIRLNTLIARHKTLFGGYCASPVLGVYLQFFIFFLGGGGWTTVLSCSLETCLKQVLLFFLLNKLFTFFSSLWCPFLFLFLTLENSIPFYLFHFPSFFHASWSKWCPYEAATKISTFMERLKPQKWDFI